MAAMYDFLTIMLVWLVRDYGVPNREDTTSFSKAGFFLNTTNFPFEGRGYFGRGSLGLSSVCPDLRSGRKWSWCSSSSLILKVRKFCQRGGKQSRRDSKEM